MGVDGSSQSMIGDSARVRPDMSDAAGFTAWVRPHWTAMARLAARLSGDGWEDVLQEALCAAWRKRGRFDEGRGSARNWLLAITADQARKAWRRSSRPGPGLVDDTPVRTGPERDLDVERALGSLSPRQRVAVELHYYLGLPIDDLAAVMGCAPGTVKSTLADARARLRAQLGADFR